MAVRPVGIDVSYWQGTGLDWAAIKAGGITFAYTRASEGTGYTDSTLAINMSHAKTAGVYIGAYHYADYNINTGAAGAIAEANHFWAAAKNYIKYGGYYLMPALDMEASTTGYTKTTLSQWAVTWCETVVSNAAAVGVTVTPVIYCSQSYAGNYFNSTVAKYIPWIAVWPTTPDPQSGSPSSFGPWSTWTLWQYSSSTTVPNHTGRVDGDSFNGTAATLLTKLVIGGAGNGATIVSSSVPGTVVTGATFTATITLQNSGGTAWTNTGATPYKLGSQSPANNTTWGLSRVALPSSPVAAGQNATFTFTATAPTNLGTYAFAWQMTQDGVVWFGSTNSTSIAVVGSNPALITQPANQTAVEGKTAQFKVVAAGAPTLAYRWRQNGTNLADGGNIWGTATATLTLTNVQLTQAGSYSVAVSNSVGSVTSADAILTVTPFVPVATWGPNATSEGQVLLNSLTISTDNHQSFTMNVGRHSTTTGYNEARPVYHWYGTGVNTPLNKDIVTTGGTFTHTCSAAYDTTASATVRAYILGTAFPVGSNDKTTVLVSWPYYNYASSLSWTTAGGDIIGSYLAGVVMTNTGTYTWTWGAIRNAGTGIQLRNATSTSDYTYRKTFTQYGKPSLTLTYLPPAGESNACVQNWNVIGTWPDSDTTLATSFLTGDDPRGISEPDMAASTGATYNEQMFAPSSQNDDKFDALDHGWGTNCTGYGFIYVYYNHASNTAVYLGVGSDDRFKLWLNGSAVASWVGSAGRTWAPDGSFVGPVTLKQGWNRVLIKVQNGAGTYGWSVRFANADRSALANCTFALTDETSPVNPTACTDSSGSTNGVWQTATAAPSFTWSGANDPATPGEGASGIKGYYVYWGTDPDGTWITQVTNSAAYAPPAVSAEGSYYLRVATYDYALNMAAWQTLYTFNYGQAPGPCSQTNALVSITQNTNGTFQFTFIGTPQARYYVVGNTNATDAVTNWVVLPDSTNTVTNSDGLWSVTVTNDSAQRFYRPAAASVCP